MFSRRVWLGVNNVVARAWADGGVAVSGNVGFGDSFFELVSPFAVTQEPFMHQHLSEPWASRLFTRNYVHARGCCILHNCSSMLIATLRNTSRRTLVAKLRLQLTVPPPVCCPRDSFATLLGVNVYILQIYSCIVMLRAVFRPQMQQTTKHGTYRTSSIIQGFVQ